MSEPLQKFTDRILAAEDVDKSDVSALMNLVDEDAKKADEFASSLRRRAYELDKEARSLARVARAIDAHVALYVGDVEF